MLPPLFVLLGLTGAPAVPLAPPCSVVELRHSPNYAWSVARIAQMVDSASRIVRVRATRADSVAQTVTFEPIEWIRGADAREITLYGIAVERDDFNTTPVPYGMVRPAGQRGDCFAREYRLGAQYLLLLQDRPRPNRIQWWPLAPLNEQLRGDDDPWLVWVRTQATRQAPEG